MRLLLLLSFATLLLGGCREDGGESLFEMVYPPQNFEIQAGRNTIISDNFAFFDIPTRFEASLNSSSHSADEVTQILPRYARLVSADGQDFSFLREISVRICPNNGEQCDLSDEVFYINDLWRRRLTTINLDPGLRNVKDILTDTRYQLNVVVSYAEITPYTMQCRFEYGFEAFK